MIKGIPVTSIGDFAFYGCTRLTEITIPESVTNIGRYAFYSCTRLTEITIPESVTSIGYDVFSGTPWLNAKCKENPLVVVNGILVDGKKCSGSVTIPDSVTSIGDDAFHYCRSLTEITIPDSVTSIGCTAFSDCTSLKEITISDSVVSIGEETFDGCSSLTEITIPDSVTSIGKRAFFSCIRLKTITIPDSVTSIGSNAFVGCTRLTIKGYSPSYAKTYANNNKITFELIEKAPTTTVVLTMSGDVNNDGTISIADAVSLQNFLLCRTKTLGNWKNADLCKDNRIDVFDMVLMRRLLIEKMN